MRFGASPVGNVKAKQQQIKLIAKFIEDLSKTGWRAFVGEPDTSPSLPNFLRVGMEKQKMEVSSSLD